MSRSALCSWPDVPGVVITLLLMIAVSTSLQNGGFRTLSRLRTWRASLEILVALYFPSPSIAYLNRVLDNIAVLIALSPVALDGTSFSAVSELMTPSS